MSTTKRRLDHLLRLDEHLDCEVRGHVLNRGKLGFEALSGDDISLGVYPTAEAATDAISEAAT